MYVNQIPQDIITEIVKESNIFDIISERVFLRKVGRNFVGLCPFHTEKEPSFTVNQEKQIYYCFGCKKGGNVLSFLMQYDGLTFIESVYIMAHRIGIKLPSLYKKKENSKQENLTKINNDAMNFFHNELLKLNLKHPAVLYLKRRGIKSETIKNFKLGYADKNWYSLKRYLLEKKYWEKNIIDISGLTVLKEDKNFSYDRFRERIIFPIWDMRSIVIGFGARVIDDSLPKYINSPETLIYSKSSSIYGINITKQECRKKGFLFIVEGYFDLITLYQAGIKNSISTLGTSITTEHIRQIKGIVGKSGKVFLVYDSDQAGMQATYRSLKQFRKEDVDISIMVLPLGYDPDSYIIEFGAEKFIAESKKAITPLSFMIDIEINKNGLDIEGKIKIVNILKHFIASNNSLISRSFDIQYLADRINVDSLIIQKEVDTQAKKKLPVGIWKNKHYENNRQDYNKLKEKANFSKTYRLEQQILKMVLHFPTSNIIDLIKKRSILNYFENEYFSNIANLAISIFNTDNNHTNLLMIMGKCNNEKEKSIIAELMLAEEKWDEKRFILLIEQFEYIILKKNNHNISKKIAEAQLSGNNKLLINLLKKRQLLLIQLTNRR